MPNSLGIIYATPASKSADAVARKWLVIFGEIHGRAISPELVGVWCRALADIEPELLDGACERTMKTCRFFPTPADVRASLDEAESNARKIEAEAAWSRVFKAASLGGRFEDFDAVTQKALGPSGWSYLVHCDSYEGAKWAEKNFVEAHTRLRETVQMQHLLGEGEAKKIVRQLCSELRRKAPRELSPAAASAIGEPLRPHDVSEIRTAFESLRAELRPSAPAPKPALTESEFAARLELLRSQAMEVCGQTA